MKNILALFLVVALGKCYAQQDPLYAQYLLNPLVLNPAYAGLNNNLNIMGAYRIQWAGFDGQPNTFNITAHSSFVENKLGAGLVIVTDKIGNVQNTEINLPLSYKLSLSKGSLSFGMQAGIQSFRVQNNELNIYDPGDFVFQGNEQGTRLNIGAGMIYRNDDWFVGLSVPRLLPTTFDVGGEQLDLYNQHYYLMASWLYRYKPDFWIRPSVMARGVSGAPASFDVSLNGVFYDRHMAGIFSRNFNTFGVLLQTIVGDKFTFGYVFEVPTKKSVGTTFNTHELTLGLRLAVLSFHDRIARNY